MCEICSEKTISSNSELSNVFNKRSGLSETKAYIDNNCYHSLLSVLLFWSSDFFSEFSFTRIYNSRDSRGREGQS